MNHVFTEQPAHEDLGPGPFVTFRVAQAEPDWVEVALPFDRLPTFYWAALMAGWAVDVGALIPECRDLGYGLLGAVGPERRGYLLLVDRKDGLTVLTATNPVEFVARSLEGSD